MCLSLQERFPQDKATVVSIADMRIAPCTGCNTCAHNKNVPTRDDLYCVIADDMVRLRAMLNECDELTVVSPVYFAGVPSQFKAFLDRLQPYFYADWHERPKRRAHVYVVGDGGDPHGFVPLVSVVRSALAVAGFTLTSVHDWVGLLRPDGAPLEGDVLQGGRVHPASAYTCTDPRRTYPMVHNE